MVVGIGGASRSGKSSLAHALKKRNHELSVTIISQDDYVYPEHKIPKIKDETDWECPESINLERFQQAIDYANINYDITIAEGLLVFHFPKLLASFDKKVFIEIDKQTFITRKESDLRWGEIPNWYKDHIWDSYLKYGLLDKSTPHSLFVNGITPIKLNEVQHFLDPANHNKSNRLS